MDIMGETKLQTFLPFSDFRKSAEILDDKRLWKQILEANQLYEAIDWKKDFYKNHPCRKMWENHPQMLGCYRDYFLREWLWRRLHFPPQLIFPLQECLIKPDWLGNPEFHLSHQSNLVRKFPEHYRKFFPNVPDNLPYYWPVK